MGTDIPIRGLIGQMSIAEIEPPIYIDCTAFSSLTVRDIVKLFGQMSRAELINEVTGLTANQRVVLVKNMTKLEVAVGGLGSVTIVHRLLDSVCRGDRFLLDWVLKNYPNYYYGMGVGSIDEYEAAVVRQTEHRTRVRDIELERQRTARARIALSATQKLFNAVRRGDLKAVAALLMQGADPNQLTPCGQSLHSYAHREGMDAMAELLKAHIK